jgi:hypothetical protein
MGFDEMEADWVYAINRLRAMLHGPRNVKAHSKFSPECTCFPEKEPPFFNWPIEQQVATQVKCPLHGERFKRVSFSE